MSSLYIIGSVDLPHLGVNNGLSPAPGHHHLLLPCPYHQVRQQGLVILYLVILGLVILYLVILCLVILCLAILILVYFVLTL